jgi:hypothetical protein
MRGCLRALGCMTLLVVVTCGAAWASRDWWLPKVGLRPPRQVASAAWEGSTEAGARRAETAVNALRSRNGPAFANLSAGDLLSYLLASFGKEVSRVADSAQASVVGERVYVRASVVTSRIPKDVIGPLSMLMGSRTRVMLGGTIRVIEPGVSEFQVKDATVGSVRVPSGMIPTLLNQLSVERKGRTAPDGFEFPTPAYIGDVRVANGRITVYKSVPTKK